MPVVLRARKRTLASAEAETFTLAHPSCACCLLSLSLSRPCFGSVVFFLFSFFSVKVLEQALWLLGNLAGEGAPARDAVLAVDALPPLVRCLERHQVCCCFRPQSLRSVAVVVVVEVVLLWG